MQIIQENDLYRAMRALAQRIIESLSKGKVLWFLSGGSNIPLSVAAMNEIRSTVKKVDLENLSIFPRKS